MAPTLSPRSGRSGISISAFSLSGPGSSLLPYKAWTYIGDSLRLSGRELSIVQGVFDDAEQESIAADLGVTPDVVYRALQRIYVKLRIGSRAELIVRVMSEYLAFAADAEDEEGLGVLCWPTMQRKEPASEDQPQPPAEICRAAGASAQIW